MTSEPLSNRFVHHLAHSPAFHPSLVSLTNILSLSRMSQSPQTHHHRVRAGLAPALALTVPTAPNPPPAQSPTHSNPPQCDGPSTPAIHPADHLTSPIPADSPVPIVPNPTDIIIGSPSFRILVANSKTTLILNGDSPLLKRESRIRHQ